MKRDLFYMIREIWGICLTDWDSLQEIRLRVHQPVVLKWNGHQTETLVYPKQEEMNSFFRFLCGDSLYAFEQERKQGFMTVSGGHRIGFTGEMIKVENGAYFTKYVSYINIRIAHEKRGLCEQAFEDIFPKHRLWNVLLVSPPGIGKTTLLRDLIRKLGNEYQVGVVDERGEIAGAYKGSACLDCGKYTDIMTGADKKTGISILVRTFSPSMIALDEIGNQKDAEAILYASVCGCFVLATVHGREWADLVQNQEISMLLEEKKFQRIVFIHRSNQETSVDIYDQDGKEICCGRELQAVSL